MNLDRLDLSCISDEVKEHALLLYQLINGLAENARQDVSSRYYNCKKHGGQVVMIASMLSVEQSCNTVNCFSHMLRLYLQGTGLKRQALQILHGLEIIDSYHALDNTKNALSK